MRKKFIFQKNGFTLPELLVAVFFLILVVGAIYAAYFLSQKAVREGEKSAELNQNGRVVLERMVREIRQAREIVTELPTTNTIKFEDGHIPERYHYIHYYKEDSDIKKEIIGYYFSGDVSETLVPWSAIPPPGQTLATTTLQESRTIGEHVTNLSFSGLRLINIFLTLENKNKSLLLSTQVLSRNI
jgi:type II secretory pathway pseudopilin PulG